MLEWLDDPDDHRPQIQRPTLRGREAYAPGAQRERNSQQHHQNPQRGVADRHAQQHGGDQHDAQQRADGLRHPEP